MIGITQIESKEYALSKTVVHFTYNFCKQQRVDHRVSLILLRYE